MKKMNSKLAILVIPYSIIVYFYKCCDNSFILGIIYSFTNWGGFTLAGARFVAFENYANAFKDANFIRAFTLTIKYAVIMVVLVNVIGFSLALLVTRKMRTRNVLRSIFFMPNLIGGLILGFIWQFIFSKLFEQIGTALHMTNIFF